MHVRTFKFSIGLFYSRTKISFPSLNKAIAWEYRPNVIMNPLPEGLHGKITITLVTGPSHDIIFSVKSRYSFIF